MCAIYLLTDILQYKFVISNNILQIFVDKVNVEWMMLVNIITYTPTHSTNISNIQINLYYKIINIIYIIDNSICMFKFSEWKWILKELI